MKKAVTAALLLIAAFSVSFAMTDRYSIAKYKRVEGMPAFTKQDFGAKIFNSEKEFGSWMRTKQASGASVPSGADYKDSSLLVAYLGQGGGGKCIRVTRIDKTHKYFVVYAEPAKCSKEWPHPYIYFRLNKTDKTAKIIMK